MLSEWLSANLCGCAGRTEENPSEPVESVTSSDSECCSPPCKTSCDIGGLDSSKSSLRPMLVTVTFIIIWFAANQTSATMLWWCVPSISILLFCARALDGLAGPPKTVDCDDFDAKESCVPLKVDVAWMQPRPPLLHGYTSLSEEIDMEWQILKHCCAGDELERVRALRETLVDLEDLVLARNETSLHPLILLQFLRGWGSDVDAAAQKVRQALKIRIDTDLSQRVEHMRAEVLAGKSTRATVLRDFLPLACYGPDRFGKPYLVWRVGDLAGISREIGRDDLCLALLVLGEYLNDQWRLQVHKAGHLLPASIHVVDVGNYGKFGVRNYWENVRCCAAVLAEVAPTMSRIYPEAIEKVFVVRGLRVLLGLWHGIKMVLPPETVEKVGLHGWNSSSWIKDMLEHVPPTSIPAFLKRETEEAFVSAVPRAHNVPSSMARFEKS